MKREPGKGPGFSYGGNGNHNHPYKLVIFGNEGEPDRVFHGEEARRIHTSFYDAPKGPERLALVRKAYES